MKKTGKIMGLVTAFSLAATTVFRVGAMADLTPEQSGQISTVIVLAENDIQGNADAIRILLEQCLTAVDETDPMAATIRSVLLLLDTGAADAASVSVLLRTLLDGTDPSAAGGETDPAETAPQTEAVPAETQAQTEPAPPETAPATEAAVPDIQAQTEPANTMEQTQAGAEPETMSPEKLEALANDPTRDVRNNVAGLPAYEVSSYIQTDLQQTVTLDVPEDWGNNASGRALTSYSPVNDSGAISPAAGTLTVSYFPMEGPDERTALDTYEKNIADMSVVTSFASEIVSAAQLSGRYLYFTMAVGANYFTCETFCFVYDGNIYAIELMQGQQTSYDYFPMYAQVVDSTQADSVPVVGTSAVVSDTQLIDDSQTGGDTQAADDQIVDDQVVDDRITDDQIVDDQIVDDQVVDDQITDDQIVDDQIVDDQIADDQAVTGQTDAQTGDPLIDEIPGGASNVDGNSILADINETGDMGVFLYEINGHVYMYPTAVSDLQAGDIPLNPTTPLPYDINSDADMPEGVWNELVNTQYFYFESSLYKELAGVTNLQGYPITVSEGVLTALIDTQGEFVNVTLPGGVKVGSYESDILKGFPRFAETSMDGLARFDGNELLYARNVRDDGCNGYALIRNDPPYYSALTIICDQGVIKEISFECLGSVRAEGVFLPE